MLTFQADDNLLYQYFAYALDGSFYIFGAWTDGTRRVDDLLHKEPTPTLPLEDWCRIRYPRIRGFTQAHLEPGQYYRRVWRGIWSPSDELASVAQETAAAVATVLLCERLFELFRVVTPSVANQTTYGHEIRNVLLLACMEVESHLAAVLRDNAYSSRQPWSINDYVHLCDSLWLANYCVQLRSYPDLSPSTPFRNWDRLRPSQSLPWWQAYNKVKHDREANFAEASLSHAMDAVCAAVVLLHAQFGRTTGRHGTALLIQREFNVSFSNPPQPESWYCPRPDKRWEPRALFP